MTGKTLTAVGSFLILAMAAPAYAQTSGGAALTLGYGLGEVEGSDFQTSLMAFDADIANGPLTFDLDLSRAAQGGDDDFDATLFTGEILPKYWFSPTGGVGLYFSSTTVDADGVDSVTANSYGLEGTYRAAGLETSAFIGETDASDLVGDDVDITDYGLRVRYDVNTQLSLYGKGVNSDFEAGGDTASAQSYALGATYDFGNGLTTFGAHQIATSDEIDSNLHTTSLGVAYNLSAAGRPILLSGEYARYNSEVLGGDADGHNITFGATVLLGDAQAKRLPGAGATRNLAKSDRNAVDGLLSVGGF